MWLQNVPLCVTAFSSNVTSVVSDGAGTHSAAWDGTANGERLPPGLYVVQLLTPSRNAIRRLVLL
jgi:hypothetical protein